MEENNQEQGYNEFENPKAQRPFALSLFCVLSFINAVYQFIAGIVMYLSYNMVRELSTDENYLELMEKFGTDTENMEDALAVALDISRNYYLLTALLYIGSFVGVYYMWKLLKKGFHIYAISQILILIVEVLMFTSATGTSPLGSVIMTAVFISMYYVHYKRIME